MAKPCKTSLTSRAAMLENSESDPPMPKQKCLWLETKERGQLEEGTAYSGVSAVDGGCGRRRSSSPTGTFL